jgi:ABC-type Mn2+/Zn2+ transport system ATPase subunit
VPTTSKLRTDLTSGYHTGAVSESGNGNQNQLDAVVRARGLVLSRGGRVVVDGADLDLPTGVISLVGPNGSGKSTLLHAIAGLLEPTSGDVFVFGRPPADVRRRIAYVLQAQHAPAHLPVTVREVVSLGRAPVRGAIRRLRAEDRDAVADAIDRVELGRLADRHLGDLSGGERQRAFVAQGLAQQADVVLLDEPTAGLDVASTEQIRAVLAAERAAGHPVILATHDLEDAASSDSVVLLAGRVVAAGRPAEALSLAHLQSAYRGRLLDVGGELVLVDDDAHHHEH